MIMNRGLLLTIWALLSVVVVNAKVENLTVSSNLRLPKDSVEQRRLVTCIDNFLTLAQQEIPNPYVLFTEKAETQILLEQISEIVGDGEAAYPCLMGVELLSDKSSYLVQVAYFKEQEEAMLLACFDFIAHRTGDGFLFSSPLSSNTKNWKVKEIGYLTFYYQEESVEKTIDQYVKYITECDKKFGINQRTTCYFCSNCESMVQLLQLAGIRYRSDYNGFDWNDLTFTTAEKVISIKNQRLISRKIVDPHDVFHMRANSAISDEKVRNRYMVCGGAYVYYGSWGIGWDEIQEMFKSRMVYDKNTDWLKLYFEWYNFGENQENHLLVTQFINALIIDRVEKEKGFSAVMELLASGNMYKDRDNFFNVLERVTGINEKNFNKKVSALVGEL